MLLEIRDLFPQHLLRLTSEQVLRSRTRKRVPLLKIDNKNQVRETLQQPPSELFSLRQLPLHLPLFGDVDQRPLIPDDISRRIPHRPRRVEKNRRPAIFPPELYLARSQAAAVIRRAPQHWLSRIVVQLRGLDRQ